MSSLKQGEANYDNTMTLNKDSDLGVEVCLTAIWIRDGQDVSMGELDNLLFVNSLCIFADEY